MKVRKVDDGRLGLEATSTIPRIADSYGSVLDFRITVKRHLENDGVKQSYVMAKCPDGNLDARLAVALADGTRLGAHAIRTCTPV